MFVNLFLARRTTEETSRQHTSLTTTCSALHPSTVPRIKGPENHRKQIQKRKSTAVGRRESAARKSLRHEQMATTQVSNKTTSTHQHRHRAFVE